MHTTTNLLLLFVGRVEKYFEFTETLSLYKSWNACLFLETILCTLFGFSPIPILTSPTKEYHIVIEEEKIRGRFNEKSKQTTARKE